MGLLEFTFLAFTTLFAIVDPLAVIPTFLAMTQHDGPESRTRMARLACCVAAGVMMVFGLIGNWIFTFLGITLPAFQMAGSVVLLLIALDMLRARRSAVSETSEETNAGAAKDDIAITPLGVPMLTGPGAITTTILLNNRANGLAQHIALYGCIALICFASYHILRISAHSAKWINPIAMKITTRLMGLLLAAIAFQFLINALKELKVIPS